MAAYSFYQLLKNKSNLERIYLLGPSHRAYLKPSVQSSGFKEWDTPFGSLTVDTGIRAQFPAVNYEIDVNEHSLEMQGPFLKYILDKRNQSGLDSSGVKIVPLLVCHPSIDEITAVSMMIAEDLKRDSCIVIISSDFCHWGRSFDYAPDLKAIPGESTPLYKRIEALDRAGQQAIERDYRSFSQYLHETENTICGKEPIKITLKLCEQLNGQWTWLKYAQSKALESEQTNDSSVSYVSGMYSVDK